YASNRVFIEYRVAEVYRGVSTRYWHTVDHPLVRRQYTTVRYMSLHRIPLANAYYRANMAGKCYGRSYRHIYLHCYRAAECCVLQPAPQVAGHHELYYIPVSWRVSIAGAAR